MKTKLNFMYILLMLVGLACSHNIEKQENFIPPTVKNAPRLIYPRIAQENLYAGTAKIDILVNKTGTVNNVYIKKSSGYNVLDHSALDYCKNLTFNPAIRNGEPVDSRVEWEIKFNFTDKNMEAYNFIRDIKNLFLKVEFAIPNKRNDIEYEILKKDKEFVQNFKDGLNFNAVIGQILLPQLTSLWEKDWDAFPLSFLLYYDFMQRFPDYDSLAVVKELLHNSLKSDILYIKNTQTEDQKVQIEKQNILNKIQKFVEKNYPDMNLDDLGLNWKAESGKYSKNMAI